MSTWSYKPCDRRSVSYRSQSTKYQRPFRHPQTLHIAYCQGGTRSVWTYRAATHSRDHINPPLKFACVLTNQPKNTPTFPRCSITKGSSIKYVDTQVDEGPPQEENPRTRWGEEGAEILKFLSTCFMDGPRSNVRTNRPVMRKRTWTISRKVGDSRRQPACRRGLESRRLPTRADVLQFWSVSSAL